MFRSAALCFLAVLLLAAPAAAQDLVAPDLDEQPADEADVPEPATFGFIFNTSNLLLDIDAYQGGFGAKLRYPAYGIRFLTSLGAESSNRMRQVGLGITYERPFFIGRVTPYWGLVADLGFQGERVEVDTQNYTQIRVVSGSLGGVLGVEVLIFDFLSVFGEYQLAFRGARTSIEQAVEGERSASMTTNYAFGADLGNNASLGLVVYLRPLGILGSADEE